MGTTFVLPQHRPPALAVKCVPKSRTASSSRTSAPPGTAGANLPMQGGPSRLGTFQAIPVKREIWNTRTRLFYYRFVLLNKHNI